MLVRFAKHHAPQLISAGLLLIMAVNLLTVVVRKSITIDETLIIPAGYYYLTTGSFHINHDHPPLAAMFTAVPLLFLPVQRPSINDLDNQPSLQQTITVGERFWAANKEHFKAIFFWTRVPIIIVTLLLGVLIFAFTRLLFNARASVLAVALFSLEPTILAHGRVVKDIDVAFAYLVFFFALYIYVSKPKLGRAILLGLACGLALSVKYSMLIVFPILLIAGCVLMFYRPVGVRRRQIVFEIITATVVSLLALNAAYLLTHQPLSIPDIRSLVQNAPAHSNTLLSLVKVGSVFVPPYFLLGAIETFRHNDIGHSAFLLGKYSEHGWWYYFPVAFALKTTVPFLLVTIASIAWALWRISLRHLKPLILLIPALIYSIFAMLAGINIGIRHFLPVFPFCFILGGALLDRLLSVEKYRPLAVASVIVVLALCSVEVVRAYPNYISYMNQLASSRPHWTYLSDSNVEWGDDAGALADYLKAKGETRVRAAFLGGSVTLPLYGVTYVDLLSPPEVHLEDTRYVALGASFLNGSTVPGWSEGSGRETPAQQHDYFARYRNREPEAVFGNSIYLYREHE
ncbi:MAG TPA: phospholipid carrier-dependent glycosyltransferase [Pyrinomonadaceae bacterium]|jgi:4-amino-4-deoxy-L-arabinose transferase-like glycosyltransferase